MSESRVAVPDADSKTRRVAAGTRVSERPRAQHAGLTSRDAWALEHITHCPTCGAWEVVTEAELLRRSDPQWYAEPWCAHVTPERVCR